MPDDQNQKNLIPINYTNRDFASIRQDLLDLAERFYPDSFQDFSEGSFGAMMVDAVAYVGDQLSLYLDYNVNESFLDTSFQTSNILRHGRALGYKSTGRPSTYGTAAIYCLIPADSVGLGPDRRYLPVLKKGASFSSQSGLRFTLTQNVDFADPKNSFVVAREDASTGAPTHFAVKAYGTVVSGRLSQTQVSVGSYERFRKVSINNPNISEIISVFDSEGNQYYEVEYLSQDMVFKEVSNPNFKNDNVPSILKPLMVSRKFVLERAPNGIVLQFGSGDLSKSDIIVTPQEVAIDVYGKSYVTDTSFDPTVLYKNKAMGIVPTDTTLFISYRETNPNNSNVAVGGLSQVNNVELDFEDRGSLNSGDVSEVFSSFEIHNETPITGDVTNLTSGEIKRRILDTFPTQNRAVTQADYENLAYRMPANFGSIKRVSVQKDQDSMKRNLNMYVVSEDSFGKLTQTNTVIKNNLRTWINNYRMINDTIDILDPYVINLGIEFVVRPVAGEDRSSVLASAMAALTKKFGTKFFIAESLFISEIYSDLKKIPGILDVVKVKIINKSGGQYSAINFDINSNLSPDGTYLIAPSNAIFEIKFPETDIKGKIR